MMVFLRVTDESELYDDPLNYGIGLKTMDVNADAIERIEHEDDWNCQVITKSGFVITTHRSANYITGQLAITKNGIVDCSYHYYDRDD